MGQHAEDEIHKEMFGHYPWEKDPLDILWENINFVHKTNHSQLRVKGNKKFNGITNILCRYYNKEGQKQIINKFANNNGQNLDLIKAGEFC